MLTDDTLDDTVDLLAEPSPPVAPYSPAQERFIELHRLHLVVKYQWLFGESQFRACTDRGKTATISAAEAQDLVDRGPFEWGVGKAYMRTGL